MEGEEGEKGEGGGREGGASTMERAPLNALHTLHR